MKTENEMYKILKSTPLKGTYVVEIDAATKKKVSAYEKTLHEKIGKIALISTHPTLTLLQKQIKITQDVLTMLSKQEEVNENKYTLYAVFMRNKKIINHATTKEGEKILQCQPDEAEKIVCYEKADELRHHYAKMGDDILSIDQASYMSSLDERVSEQFGFGNNIKSEQEKETRLQKIINFLDQEREIMIKKMEDINENDDIMKAVYNGRAAAASELSKEFLAELRKYQQLRFQQEKAKMLLKPKDAVDNAKNPTATANSVALNKNPNPLILSGKQKTDEKPKTDLPDSKLFQKSLSEITNKPQTPDQQKKLKEHVDSLKKEDIMLNLGILRQARDNMCSQNMGSTAKVHYWRILNNFLEIHDPEFGKESVSNSAKV